MLGIRTRDRTRRTEGAGHATSDLAAERDLLLHQPATFLDEAKLARIDEIADALIDRADHGDRVARDYLMHR
ncbi:hypothetical protein P0W64_13295 [Tsukamurella sp. 8F]|uniref:hypothetical protein n=1 Tax=unclassified Tsukamurella TaxID=2633480 RepID=UPI0023B9B4EF|nr:MULTISPECIES: hypothetical protein [unclassified Tsukamurella]MDF0530432.1 hypothetical protein [Tsukamurella sp. 8J]MDF0587747.1 hypothetical protein [Tsukamurella sp. 8F]